MSNQRICFICRTYVYWGIPIDGIKAWHGKSSIELSDCYIIYDTGPWNDPEWKIAEYLGNWSVRKDALESWGAINKRLPAVDISAVEQGETIRLSPWLAQSVGNRAGHGTDE